ncbi:hypothetical protein [Yonghaparkia sp. Soil809]|uniref:hypothetical protein n=1 Tax=Yonghaparkia sp. Soil809 TaxID=1736417 RepID=UPI0006F84CFE|nr:hypothetical protein [Yonghaparkia sp. Soil809]KRF30984.1 hypothetical protein ASG83_09115 [Yonghaparkia sp. Soil809]
MRPSRRLQFVGTSALFAAFISGALALFLAAIVAGAMLRYSDAGAAQGTCLSVGAGPGVIASEAAVPIGEPSAWPLGLRCIFPAADGGTIVVEPDLTLSMLAVASVGLAAAGAAAWTFGCERRRLARHERVLELRLG